MRIVEWVIVVMALVNALSAQSANCRQSWMSADAPAFCAWDAEPSLPQATAYPAVSAAENHIYVLGGFRYDGATKQVIYYDTVVESTLGSDGRLPAWSAEPSFKNGRSGAASAIKGNCLFLAGGSSSTPTSQTYFDDIQFAKIGNDGHLSRWATSPNHLKIPRSNLSLVALTTDRGVFLNAVAGVTQIGNDTVHLDSIEVAKVDDDCAVGDWTLANYHLKGGRSSPQALSMRGNLVVVGGWGDLDQIDVYDDVETSTPRSDGSPNPWRFSASRLTTGIYGHATVLAEPDKQPGASLLMTVGGQPGTGAYANWISYAYVQQGVNLPDAIGIWRIAGTGRLSSGRAGLAAVEAHDRIYVIGGNDASGQYYRDVVSARFDPGHP